MATRPIVVPRTPIIICDIDGTVSCPAHRLHHIIGEKKDWDAFYAEAYLDTPYIDIISLVRSLPAPVYFVTGRKETIRKQTMRWLEDHMLVPTLLLMRAEDDRREDFEVKLNHLDRIGVTPEHVWFVLEDRDQVVKAYRERGFRVLQVSHGDY